MCFSKKPQISSQLIRGQQAGDLGSETWRESDFYEVPSFSHGLMIPFSSFFFVFEFLGLLFHLLGRATHCFNGA